ncbi:MAG: 4a-hydroxytetrahydrobiopterin dehydratase [Flavobacteriaceae bacterium]
MAGKLSDTAIADALAGLSGWSLSADAAAIEKTFRFKDFSAALGFMVRVGLAAEAMDHHPDWTNVYNRVEVRLTTHSARALTELDFRLAAKMDEIAGA